MTDEQATLQQLQHDSDQSLVDESLLQVFQHAVSLNPNSRGVATLKWSGVLLFGLSFLLHQLYLKQQNTLPLAAQIESPAVVVEKFSLEPSASVSERVVQHQVDFGVPQKQVGADSPLSEKPAGVEMSGKASLVFTNPLTQAEDSGFRAPLKNTSAPDPTLEQYKALHQRQLELLLKNAEFALSNDRLLTPINDNAVHYLRAMLDLDPGNVAARAGLEKVAQRYRQFALRLMRKHDTLGAASMMEKAESVVGRPMTLLEVDKSFDQAEYQPKVNADVAYTSQALSSATVTPSAQTRAEGIKEQAKVLLGRGETYLASELLEAQLPEHSTDGEWVELLHQSYVASSRTNDATKLRVTVQGALPSYRIARMQAVELMQQGNTLDALAVLERNLPEYAQDQSYYGLLAGLYYRNQRYADAEIAYQKLLGLSPKQGSYWLGYAVALDAQKNTRALNAFEMAQSTLSLKDPARPYVEQRIRELNGS